MRVTNSMPLLRLKCRHASDQQLMPNMCSLPLTVCTFCDVTTLKENRDVKLCQTSPVHWTSRGSMHGALPSLAVNPLSNQRIEYSTVVHGTLPSLAANTLSNQRIEYSTVVYGTLLPTEVCTRGVLLGFTPLLRLKRACV
jgi:hypothetical protein